ncbi:hypothetical protein PF005_g15583 [Phytophthora fragariae]|uniref:Uncharacterized protein n=2 Tax=Phytophthora fragariae TaxID=53985 RepID=A0A6A3XCU1_9STRA|nr:hypothetical protein PF007_g15954 [Phytophthora fragariae]KAE9199825.1 hypothetical protein PF005_g15583 [Phytophthora fragariae]
MEDRAQIERLAQAFWKEDGGVGPVPRDAVEALRAARAPRDDTRESHANHRELWKEVRAVANESHVESDLGRRNDAKAAAMDPDHVACYAQAQVELRELFHELECNGQVSAAELQWSLVPFTAGDVKRDLLSLLAELKSKHQSLDEAEFLRVMWRKLYLASAVDATKSGAAGQHKSINVSLAHVIVSVKRRQQLRQFASYYASRGISGADHLTPPPKGMKGDMASAKSAPLQSPSRKEFSSSPQLTELRGQSSADKAGVLPVHSSFESISALRRRVSACYDVVACVFDAEVLQMRPRTLLSRTRSAEVRSCSQLYCLLFSKDAGNFILGCTYFAENARRNHQDEKVGYEMTAGCSWFGWRKLG